MMNHSITLDPVDRYVVWKCVGNDMDGRLVNYFIREVVPHLSLPYVLLIDLRGTSYLLPEVEQSMLRFAEQGDRAPFVGIAYLVDVCNQYRMKSILFLNRFPKAETAIFTEEEAVMGYLDGLVRVKKKEQTESEVSI